MDIETIPSGSLGLDIALGVGGLPRGRVVEIYGPESSGNFSAVQKDVYELVLASQEAAIKAVKPGADFIDYHDAATRVLVQGLIDFKLCKGSVDAVLADESYKQFYMHRTGHWLGLDVHDAGDYMQKGDRKSTRLNSSH